MKRGNIAGKNIYKGDGVRNVFRICDPGVGEVSFIKGGRWNRSVKFHRCKIREDACFGIK